MPAHAVDDEQERCMLGNGRDDPVLIFFSRPDERDVRVLDPQEATHASDKMSGAYITHEQISVSHADA
jgi:hypothetical protein